MCQQCKKCPNCIGREVSRDNAPVAQPVVPYLVVSVPVRSVSSLSEKSAQIVALINGIKARENKYAKVGPVAQSDCFVAPQAEQGRKPDLVVLQSSLRTNQALLDYLSSSSEGYPFGLYESLKAYINQLEKVIKAVTLPEQ